MKQRRSHFLLPHRPLSMHTIRRAKTLAALNAIQLQSVQSGKNEITIDEINREICTVRKGR
ncbi:MAG: hypothetical protein JXA18_13770 [Chitinispirillaceae bacterium]|nr:hypothetical protein [Chitinispirillaceae bacterium]